MIKRHYEKHYKSRYHERAHLVFLLDAVLVSIAFALIGLGCYFRWFYHPLRDTFKLEITTVSEVVGGQESEISVSIRNIGKQMLTKAHASVYLPKAFLSEDGQTGVRQIEIGQIMPGAQTNYRFRGIPIGPPQTDTIAVHFTATDENGQADEKLAAADLTWEKNLVEARWETPTSIAKGQRFPISIVIKNGSSLTFGYVRVTPTWPVGFRPVTSTPPISNGEFVVGELSPGEEVRVDIFGTYTGEADSPAFAADVQWIDGGRVLSIADAGSTLKNFETGLRVSAAFSQYFLKTISADHVDFIVTYRNEGTYVLKDARFGMVTDPRVVDRVEWTAADTVSEIAPGASGLLGGTIHLKDRLSEFVVTPNLTLTPEVTISVPEAGIEGATIRGEGQTAKVAGQAYLAATARYYTDEGDQIGRGTWPPKVGATTRYWIMLKAESGASPLSDIHVDFSLPKNVKWTGRSSLVEGQSFGACTELCPPNGLVWIIGELPAHAGILSPAASLALEVAFTPTVDQAGRMPPVILDGVLGGHDAWADTSVLKSIGDPAFPAAASPKGGTVTVRP